MARRLKPEYRLTLPSPVKPKRTGACVGLKLRRPTARDTDAMGALLLDAYRGTVDDEGEDLAAATAFAKGFLDGEHGRAMLDLSVAAWRGPSLVAVCAVAWLDFRTCPFVVYVATASDAKRQGVGRLVLGESIRRAGRAGHPQLRAFITKGNGPSQALFASMGFERVHDPAPKS